MYLKNHLSPKTKPKMTDFDLHVYLAAKRKQINSALEGILGSASNADRVAAAMRYSLTAGGKRVRPILCIAAAEAVGGMSESVIRAACALELIHTYSLIHDDLPAMDDDELRRGQPTCHVAFDEPTAILAGDGLLTLAFELLSSGDFLEEKQAVTWLRVVHQIASAAGYQGMVEGQMRDIVSEGTVLDIAELEAMHALKTGALIEAAVHSGAVLGGGTPDQIKQLQIYAKNIGLAFQVADDILNIEGNPALMGKDVGTDHIRKKNTYPSILGIKESKALAKKLVDEALYALDFFDNKADPLRHIANYVIARKR